MLMTQKLVSAVSSSSSTARKKRHQVAVAEDEPWTTMAFPTNFNAIVGTRPPQAPPGLMRLMGGQQTTPIRQSTGKVKAMLRVCPVDGSRSSFLVCDEQKKQVTVLDQSVCAHHSVTTSASVSSPSAASSRRRPLAPKTFVFDSIFSQDSSMSEICSTTLVDIIQAVVGGQDGCVFSYGHARLGKTYTMLGVDDCPQNLGVIPCAIAWLYRLIDDRKQSTTMTRFSVRVSAVEVTGRQETLTDLLAGLAGTATAESGGSGPAGVFLRDDPMSGIQLENQSELRAPTAQHAAFYLDAAISARTISGMSYDSSLRARYYLPRLSSHHAICRCLHQVDDDARNSHLLFTLNVYQYRVDHDNSGQDEVVGGRSRLHLLDLGSCSRGKNASGSNSSALSLSSLGGVLLALLNGQRHVPHRDSKLTQLLWDTLSGSSSSSSATNCCIIAHVSPADHAYIETLQVIQLASRIFRIRIRKKNKPYGTSSDDSSQDGSSAPSPLLSSRSLRRPTPMQVAAARRLNAVTGSSGSRSSGLSSSDLDYTSSSEQSCDTVIYVGKNGRMLSDRELTDNEGPPPTSPLNRTPATSSELPSSRQVSSTTTDGGDHRRDVVQTYHCKEGPLPVSLTQTNTPTRSNASKQLQKTTPRELPTALVDLSGRKLTQQKPAATAAAAAADETRPHGDDGEAAVVPPSTATVASTETGTFATPSSGKIRRKVRRPHLPTAEGGVDGEQWIDGPNAVLFVASQSTKVTGVLVVGEVSGGSSAVSGMVHAVVNGRRPANDEKWIDGPPEFRADALSSPSGGKTMKARLMNGRMPKCPSKSVTSNHRNIANECGQDGGDDDVNGDVTASVSRTACAKDQTVTKEIMVTTVPIEDHMAATVQKLRTERLHDQHVPEQNGFCDISAPGTPSKRRIQHQYQLHHHHHQSPKRGPANSLNVTSKIDNSSTNEAANIHFHSTSPARSRHAPSNQHSVSTAMNIPSSSPRHSGAAPVGRVAQWVRSVQAATAAAFSGGPTTTSIEFRDPIAGVGSVPQSIQTWSSSSPSKRNRNYSPYRLRSAERAFRDPFGFLIDSFDSESDATVSVGNNSPPPDYASCIAADRRFSSSAGHLLDINENEANGNGGGGSAGLGMSAEHSKYSGRVGTFDWPPSDGDFRRLQRTAGVWTYVPSPLLVASPGTFTCFPTSGHQHHCTNLPESVPEVYDVSTWPRRHQATADDDDPTQCKRLHHPDGASDPKLSVLEVTRPPVLDSLKVLSDLVPPPQIASVATCLQQSFAAPPYIRSTLDARALTKHEPAYAVPTKTHRNITTPAVDGTQVTPSSTRIAENGTRRAEVTDWQSNELRTEPPLSTKREHSTSSNPLTTINHVVPVSDVQSLASTSRSPSLSGSGSDTKTKSSTSSMSSSSSSSKAVERCRSSSGISLLSCISPRRRARPFAGLFSRSHGSRDLPNEPPLNPSSGVEAVAASGTPELGAMSSCDDSGCEPGNVERCLQDSDRGSSLCDFTVPPGAPTKRIPGVVEMDTNSDYGSGQVDGEPNSLTTGFTAVITEDETKDAIHTDCIDGEPRFAELIDHVLADVTHPALPGQPTSHDSSVVQPTVCFHSKTADDTWSNEGGRIDDTHSTDEVPGSSVETRRHRITELLARQRKLKTDLASAKTTLMVDPDSWSYDLHVAEQLDRDDPGYIEALERETAILEKRVVACKSRIMIVTVFDVTNT